MRKKVLFVAPANNYHTHKWCRWFIEHDYSVSVISFTEGEIAGAEVYVLKTDARTDSADTKKLRYLLHVFELRRIVAAICPDMISVHFASSYGAVAALSGIKGYALSVWGADIYDFPQKSWMHRKLLKFSLSRAAMLMSTSRAMAEEGRKYTDKTFVITPFGVDTSLFNPKARTRSDDSYFVIGTVKALLPKYGIDYLIKAAAIVKQKREDIPLRLLIAGKGENENEYKALADRLGLRQITEWAGYLTQEEVPRAWADMDVAVIPSVLESESFGVSAIEAQACGTALIISDIPGLCEAASDGDTCLVVPRKNAEAIAEAIICLYDFPDKRNRISRLGRKHVENRYELDKCFVKIEKALSGLSNGGV